MKKPQLKVLRDIRVHRYQFAALIVIVMLGVASFIGLIAAYQNLSRSYNHTYDLLNFADATIAVEGAPTSVVGEIVRLAGVAAAEGRLVVDTGLWLGEQDRSQVRLIGLPADRHPTVNDVHVERGRYFRAEDRDVVLLERHFADFYSYEVGTAIHPIIAGERMTLNAIGIAASPEYLILAPSQRQIMISPRQFAVLFVPQPTLQDLIGFGDRINQVSLRVTDRAQRGATLTAVEEILAPYRIREIITRENQPSNAALQLDLEGYRELAWMLPSLILLAAALSVYIALSRMIQAQRPQIGLFKALGYPDRSVLRHYLLFSLVVALIGTILGLALGQGISGALTRIYATELGIPFVKTAIYPVTWVEGALLSLIFCVVAGFLPARAATKLRPAEAMRLDPAVTRVQGYVPLVERFFARLVSLPVTVKIPLRNLFRNRRRTLSTATGLMFAFILLLATWAFFDSMDHMLNRQYRRIERWDIAVDFSSPQPDSLTAQIAAWDGVQIVEPTLQLPGTVRTEDGARELETLIIAMEPTGTLHQLQLPEGMSSEAALRSGQVVLTPPLTRELNVDEADRVTVETPWGAEPFTVSGVSDEIMGTVAYIPLADGHRLMGAPMPWLNGLYLSVDEADLKAVQVALYRLPDTSGVQIKREIVADWREILALFYAFMGVILGFALIMAFAIVFNTVTVNVLEREREIGTMRTLGSGRRQIVGLVTVENLLIGFLSVAPGLLLGVAMAYELMGSFTNEMFTMQLKIYPWSYVIVVGGVLITILISQLPALRRLNRLDLAEVTKIST
ncbi:MAG: FtsX-like permease family protein [Candidatus Bipolaricaulia bacterium]